MIKINLLGNIAVARAQVRWELWLLLATLVVLLSVSMLGRLWFSKQADELRKSEEGTSRELVYVKALAHRVRTLEDQRMEVSAELTALEALLKAKQSTVRILDSIVSALPEHTWLVELRETEQGIRVSGLAQDGETISKFARELERSPSLVRVAIDVARQSLRHGVKLQEFSIGAQRSHTKPPLVRAPVDIPKEKAKK